MCTEVHSKREVMKMAKIAAGTVKRFFSCAEVGVMVGRSAATVRKWIKAGKLGAVKMGPNSLLIPREAVDSLAQLDG
jgi:excisionase family DNA binding protein